MLCSALGIKDKQDRYGVCVPGASSIEVLILHLMGPQCRKVESGNSGEDEWD